MIGQEGTGAAVLTEDETLYRVLVESSPDALAVANLQGHLIRVNRRAAEQYGIDASAADGLVGRHVTELLAPEDRQRAADNFRTLLAQGQHTGSAYRALLADGTMIPVEINSRVVRDEAGKPKAVIAVVRDVSARRHTEELIARAARQEAAATLAGGVAHDFNNLMLTVIGNAELLRFEVDADQEDHRALLGEIADAARRAAELAQKMLAFARGGKYQPETLDLNVAVAEVDALQGEPLAAVEIEHQLAADLWPVEADPTQLQEVLVNLRANAVEAVADCPPDRRRVTIRTRNLSRLKLPADCRPRTDADRWVHLAVQDTGCGMSDETLGRAFDPFFTTRAHGRGLGLAAVSGINANHQGLVACRSSLGEGSTIDVYLPASSEAKPAPPQSPMGERRSVQPLAALRHGEETILLIDDDDAVVETTRRLLERLGHRVLVARHGADGVELARTHDGPIHLAMLDMGMPVMDGPTAFPQLAEARPEMRILLCSGYHLDTAARGLLDRGAVGFLQKPFRLETLAERLGAALDRH